MGKGDKKTKKGKLTIGTYGARRRKKSLKKHTPVSLLPAEKAIKRKN